MNYSHTARATTSGSSGGVVGLIVLGVILQYAGVPILTWLDTAVTTLSALGTELGQHIAH